MAEMPPLAGLFPRHLWPGLRCHTRSRRRAGKLVGRVGALPPVAVPAAHLPCSAAPAPCGRAESAPTRALLAGDGLCALADALPTGIHGAVVLEARRRGGASARLPSQRHVRTPARLDELPHAPERQRARASPLERLGGPRLSDHRRAKL